jgi:mannose/cellobiose epimerase-like protein (N-acyl-D-glucosamine 2-epimerase family)
MINHEAGEWFALLERDGTVRWDYLGHAWKNNYHTTRSMVQSLRRLREISRRGMDT